MKYIVTVQLGGLLVCSNCFDADMSVVNNTPIDIRILDHRGKVMSTVEGSIDCSGHFYV
jgi:hypothetical protein